MNKEGYTLLVVNQDVSLSRLVDYIKKKKFKACLVLSSYYLFDCEREFIESGLNISVEFACFGDYLTDSEMQSCDNVASSIAKCFGELLVGKNNDYNDDFEKWSAYCKNLLIYMEIRSHYTIEQIYYISGLGVSQEFWREVGAALPFKERLAKIRSLRDKLKRLYKQILSANSINYIIYNGDLYVFPVSLGRLRFDCSEVEVERYKANIGLTLIDRVLGKKVKQILTDRLLAAKFLNGRYRRVILCMTMHEYFRDMLKPSLPVYVFTDGFHPANFTCSYLPSYDADYFITKDMFDEQWFTKCGKKTLFGGHLFMEKECMAPVSKENGVQLKVILLALNHAGDWSALINRSDTDKLVAAFVGLSKSYAGILFIVRAHPTMLHQKHEGLSSMRRLSDYIARQNQSNLVFSKRLLEDDLAVADLVLSEYSNVLLDAYKNGKLGLVVNLTSRRSYMSDYENLGFQAANNVNELESTLYKYVHSTEQMIDKQNNAVARYNEMLRNHSVHSDDIAHEHKV